MGRDVFVALPTGYGKSLCYCCLPRVVDLVRSVEKQSIVVVVSPLIALMKDQVAACHSKGLTRNERANNHSGYQVLGRIGFPGIVI